MSLFVGRRRFKFKEIKELFNFSINAEQNGDCIDFNVRLIRDPYKFSGLYELPRELNRIIMSYLRIHIEFTLIINPPVTYPFLPFKWELGGVIANGTNDIEVYKCLKYAVMRENSQFAKDFSPAWSTEAMSMLMFYRIQKDLQGTIAFEIAQKNLKNEILLPKPFPWHYLQIRRNIHDRMDYIRNEFRRMRENVIDRSGYNNNIAIINLIDRAIERSYELIV
tara:strand:+ start:24437 stop:25102 length:666 start_codon:yes stop_codon:yes gene_type:complete